MFNWKLIGVLECSRAQTDLFLCGSLNWVGGWVRTAQLPASPTTFLFNRGIQGACDPPSGRGSGSWYETTCDAVPVTNTCMLMITDCVMYDFPLHNLRFLSGKAKRKKMYNFVLYIELIAAGVHLSCRGLGIFSSLIDKEYPSPYNPLYKL